LKLRGALTASALSLVVSGAVAAQAFDPFGTVSLTVDFTLNGQGANVDSIAFYEAPDPGDTLLFVTSKGSQLVEVWGQPFVGNELTPLTHASFAQGSSQVNGIAIDQATDRLYVAVGSPASTVVVFSLPGLAFVDEFIAGAVDLRAEPNLALLRLDGGGTRLYVSADTLVYMRDASSGADLGSFAPEVGLETLVSDALEQTLHIPDENGGSGIYTYDPDGAPAPAPGANVFGGGGIFQADEEGILLYTCPAHGLRDDGRGFFVVSDQRASQTEFEFFDRSSRQHLGALRLDGVSNTDGIASTQRPLPGHPRGLFAAIDNDQMTVGVDWQRILDATGIDCGPDEDSVPSLPATWTGVLGALLLAAATGSFRGSPRAPRPDARG
jgi:myo-inositol-hexaphosphate 3-phosphohydrolase